MVLRIHALAGFLALLTVLGFFGATLAVELLGDGVAVAAVKRGIVWGLPVLVLFMGVTGATGARLARGGQRSGKGRRMRLIAANGLLVLVPCALVLAWLAGQSASGPLFYGAQALELVAGAGNLVLLGRNLREGLALAAARQRAAGNLRERS